MSDTFEIVEARVPIHATSRDDLLRRFYYVSLPEPQPKWRVQTSEDGKIWTDKTPLIDPKILQASRARDFYEYVRMSYRRHTRLLRGVGFLSVVEARSPCSE